MANNVKRDIQDYFITIGLIADKAINQIQVMPIQITNDIYFSGVKNDLGKKRVLINLTRYSVLLLNGTKQLSTFPKESIWVDSELLDEEIVCNTFKKLNKYLDSNPTLRTIEIEYPVGEGKDYDCILFDKVRIASQVLATYKEKYGENNISKKLDTIFDEKKPKEKTVMDIACGY